jgi:hypothetical protein
MKINGYLIALLFSVLFVNAQKDSIRKKPEVLSHFAGIDIGYTGYDHISGYKAETNLNYVFNPQYFIAKVQLGIAPGTNFGTLIKGFVGIGFSTKTNKVFSWHLMHGMGAISPTKDYTIYEPNGNNPKVERTYHFFCRTLYVETGFYSKPLKHKRLILGLNALVFISSIIDSRSSRINYDRESVLTPNINFSIKYKLSK